MNKSILLAALALTLATAAHARPTYFDVLTTHYGLTAADDIHACGVCHLRWEGTGARNPYGSAIEQQVYIGTPILDAILNIEGNDTDSDGFTNLEELSTHRTLPGYNCTDFFFAINAPSDVHTFVTPLVASCLEPLDIRVDPDEVSMLAEAGEVATVEVEVFNNGSDFALDVSSYAILSGPSPVFAVTGPAAPFSIPVGASVILEVAFTPNAPGAFGDVLRISSNDPDQGTFDVPLSAIAFVITLAPAEERAACLREASRQMQRYGKKHLRAWGDCYLDEVGGVACDTGSRDLDIAQAEAKLRDKIGGAKDKRCAGEDLTPSLLGLPSTCPVPCDGIALTSIVAFANCLVCQQDAATSAMLDAAVGTIPPDLPLNSAAGAAVACQKQLLKGIQKGIAKVQKELDACELESITAPSPIDCAATLAGEIAEIRAKVDARLESCTSTTGLLACPLVAPFDPMCLGTAAESIGTGLDEAVFGSDD